MNVRSIVSVALVLTLLMFVVHCTYVTSNAYSHPSIVLQSQTNDGYLMIKSILYFYLLQRSNNYGRFS